MVHIGAGVCLKRIYEISRDGFGKGKGWVCTPGATSRNFLDNMGWKKVPMSKSGGVVLGPTNTKKGERGSGPKNMDCMRPICTMSRLNYAWPGAVLLFDRPGPFACSNHGWLSSHILRPQGWTVGNGLWADRFFSLILRPSNLCFRCWTLRSSPCSGKWPLPSSHRRCATAAGVGAPSMLARATRCTCRHPWQGHGLAWSSDWLSQNLPWEVLFAVSLFFLISKAARKMTCHATRDELHTKSKLRVMHVLKDEYSAQWFLVPIETFSTRGSKSLHPYTQHIPCWVWVLFRVPSWLLDSWFQKNRGINSPPQTSIILAWVSTHEIHVVYPDVYWLDGMFCSEWDVCFFDFLSVGHHEIQSASFMAVIFLVTKDLSQKTTMNMQAKFMGHVTTSLFLISVAV